MTGIGLDISKEAIKMAARDPIESLWLLGDLANTSLIDQSCDVILSILSPANYKEFKRLLVSNGLVIKVVPRANYFMQLRKALHDEKDTYENEKIISLFCEQFHLVGKFPLIYTMQFSDTEIHHLIRLSTLAWNIRKEEVDRVIAVGLSDITVDLDILIGLQE